ncbi:MAG: DUF4124 domain-containing protein [Geobacter sp.]|nr:DUF4124 domain-containing protein [Geobacter sp.]
MKYRLRIGVAILLLLVAGSSHCMVYMWQDSSGVTHYTNKDYEIPPRYSSRVKILYPETAEKPAGQTDATREQVIAESPHKPPTPVVAAQPLPATPLSAPHKRVKKPGRAFSDEE